ncbi:integrase_H2C2 domain-containing protein [Trichonephila clavata]|uniref:Integrase_H2C2 domain-containing protein n=1 Tax=Trichonephila clavata TaxID=2740835 RepID=A0A8X6J984_TRICU|nr:integrase_H2C2 domain-containing protein [Trichonephila clavata]
MGKLSNESKFKSENSLVHSLLTNREKISDLWEFGSLGIKDPSEKRSKLELQDLALKHFENTVLRDDKGRYIVSIPWIEESEKLEDHYSLAKERLEKNVKTLKFTGRLFDYEQRQPTGIRPTRNTSAWTYVECERRYLFHLLQRNRTERRSNKKENPFLSSSNFRPDWIHVSYHPHPQITYTRVLEDRSFMGIQITSRHQKKIPGVEKTTYREIQDIKIPRRLSNLDLKDANLSLQVFCDASKLSYATCIFLRAEREGEVTC